jgi:hypothetical protein
MIPVIHAKIRPDQRVHRDTERGREVDKVGMQLLV